MGKRFHLLLAMLGAMATLGCVGCRRPAAPPPTPPGHSTAPAPIRIGAFFSTTGNEAGFGISSMNGLRLAIEEINAAGGVLGRPLEVVAEDDQSQADRASFAVQKLINHDHVDVVLGEVSSTRSIAGGEIAQGARVPMLSPSSTNPKVTETKEYVFRACFIDPFQGYAMATFAFAHLHARTAAILTDKESDYSVGLARWFRERFERLGGRVLDEQFYDADDTDFKTPLNTLVAQSPDVLFVPGDYGQVGVIVRQARQAGYDKPLLGGDGWDSPRLVEIGGKALSNAYCSVHVDLHSSDPRVKHFVEGYRSRFGHAPDSLGALAYDSVHLLADAYARAGDTDKEKLRDALATTEGFRGVTGVITMTADRDPVKPAVVVKYVNGVSSCAATIEPEGTTPSPASSAPPRGLSPSPHTAR